MTMMKLRMMKMAMMMTDDDRLHVCGDDIKWWLLFYVAGVWWHHHYDILIIAVMTIVCSKYAGIFNTYKKTEGNQITPEQYHSWKFTYFADMLPISLYHKKNSNHFSLG